MITEDRVRRGRIPDPKSLARPAPAAPRRLIIEWAARL